MTLLPEALRSPAAAALPIHRHRARRGAAGEPSHPAAGRRSAVLAVVALVAGVLAALSAVPSFTPAASALTGAGGYVPLAPARILDTRTGSTGDIRAALTPNSFFDQQINGRGGLPSSGVAAVVLNVTVVAGSQPGFITVYPSGEAFPPTSNVNFVGGQTVPNLVQVKVGTNGRVTIYNSAGTNHLIFDVAGYYTGAGQPAADGYVPFAQPARLYDSRTDPTFDVNGQSQGVSPITAGETVAIDVDDNNDFDAIALNVTAVNASIPTFVSVFPFNTLRTPPSTSNVNVLPNEAVANAAVVKLSSDGQILIYNPQGSVDVVIDAVGAFTRSTVTDIAQQRFNVVTPNRILSTRDGIGAAGFVGQTPFSFKVTGKGGVSDDSTIGAIVMNVTATQPSADSYFAVYSGAANPPPETSSVNFRATQSVPNLVMTAINTDGTVNLYNRFGLVHAIYDVFGYFQAVPTLNEAGRLRHVDALSTLRVTGS